MRHPFYFLICALTCFYLYRANDRGWSFLGVLFSPLTSGGSSRSGLYHK